MSVAPNAGIVDLDTFLPPTASVDGQQGQVPKPLAGQQDYVLTANGFVPGGSLPGLGTMATQNANAVAITGGTIDGTILGGTTPSAGTFTTLIGGGDSANYGQLTGGATTKAVQFRTLGSDTNIALALQSKGTGAIDLAAGSSGVNISNGGTVTAITRTAVGSAYTSLPSCSISAPTTAGGVQATVTPSLSNNVVVPTITSGGTGYTAGDVLTLSGGTFSTASTLTVTTVSGGVITGVSVSAGGAYTVLPSNPISVTGGTGTGATFTINSWGLGSVFTITNAGSGYVEQPTVSFSGGGGSGAAAYATVGTAAIIKSIGAGTASGVSSASLVFATPNTVANALTIRDIGGADTGVLISPAAGYTNITALGATNATLMLASAGTNSIYFNTQGTSQTNQMRVSHTASAVNYVQVTGAATTGTPVISVQGSDSNIALQLNAKGGAGVWTQYYHRFGTGYANNIEISGAASTVTPYIKSIGSDTNIDLALTPKGTGVVQFGTYTASVLSVTGYITVKDSGGTTRRLLVG